MVSIESTVQIQGGLEFSATFPLASDQALPSSKQALPKLPSLQPPFPPSLDPKNLPQLQFPLLQNLDDTHGQYFDGGRGMGGVHPQIQGGLCKSNKRKKSGMRTRNIKLNSSLTHSN